MLDSVIKYIVQEFRVIGEAPIVFTAAILAVLLVCWLALDWRYTGILENRDAELRLAKTQRDDYRNKLDGQSPDQARAKIEALEAKIRLTVGEKWEPLSADDVRRLSEAVKDLPKRRIQVMHSNYLGKDLAQTIADAFQMAGWQVHFSEGGGLGLGVSTGRGNGMALTLKRVIESSTRLKQVGSFGPDEPDTPSNVFVSVGINAI